MFPDDASVAHQAVLSGSPAMRPSLDRFDIDLVTVLSASATAQVLTTDPAWRVLYADERWALLCRRSSNLGGTLGTC